jgi:hypothetical protein
MKRQDAEPVIIKTLKDGFSVLLKAVLSAVNFANNNWSPK